MAGSPCARPTKRGLAPTLTSGRVAAEDTVICDPLVHDTGPTTARCRLAARTEESRGLVGYVEILRERWRFVAIALSSRLAPPRLPRHRRQAVRGRGNLLVTPVSGDDPVYTGLPLIRESSDPTRDVETAAQLVTTRDVAARVIEGSG